jgi:hypothetical protein
MTSVVLGTVFLTSSVDAAPKPRKLVPAVIKRSSVPEPEIRQPEKAGGMMTVPFGGAALIAALIAAVSSVAPSHFAP